jgi:hypothetical protein
VRVLLEKHDFVAIAYRNFTFAALALEAVDHDEPNPFTGTGVAAVRTFKRKFHLP